MKKPETTRLGLALLLPLIGVLSFLAGCFPIADFRGVREEIMFKQLPGEGQFVDYRRNGPTKAPGFPLEAAGDGFKMMRIFRDMDADRVEWIWRVTLRNKTDHEVVVTVDYHLQDEADLPLTTSQYLSRPIAPGQIISLEKKDSLSYEKAIRVKGSSWDIHLQ